MNYSSHFQLRNEILLSDSVICAVLVTVVFLEWEGVGGVLGLFRGWWSHSKRTIRIAKGQ
jgi:hypothetical protein